MDGRRLGSPLLAEVSRSVAARRAGAGGSTETTRAGAEVRKRSSASRRRFVRGASAARGGSILRTQFLRLPTTRIASPRRDLAIRRGEARRVGGQHGKSRSPKSVQCKSAAFRARGERGKRGADFENSIPETSDDADRLSSPRSRAGAGGSTGTTLAGAEVRKRASASCRCFAHGAIVGRGKAISRTQCV